MELSVMINKSGVDVVPPFLLLYDNNKFYCQFLIETLPQRISQLFIKLIFLVPIK
jgi:hypothetical protein